LGASYGGHIEQKHKLEWITKAISYPAIEDQRKTQRAEGASRWRLRPLR